MTEDTLHSLFEMIRGLAQDFDELQYTQKSSLDRLSVALTEHMAREEIENQAVNAEIRGIKEASVQRHETTTKAITDLCDAVNQLTVNVQHSAPCDLLVNAIPKKKDGKTLDSDGHCAYHENEIERFHDSKKTWGKIKDNVIAVLAISLTSVFLSLLTLGIRDYIQHPTAVTVEQIEHKVEQTK